MTLSGSHFSTMARNAKMPYILSIDAEATSHSTRSWAVAVGICVISPEGNVTSKHRWSIMPCPESDVRFNHSDDTVCQFDPRINPNFYPYFDRPTYQEFWSRHLPVFLEFQASLKPPELAWNDISEVINSIYAKYTHVTLVSDCPDFDVNAFNRNLFFHTGNELGVRFPSIGGIRHALFNPNDAIKWLREGPAIRKAASDVQVHDHRPENDAHQTAIIAHIVLTRRLAGITIH